jgi:hypothetical protein
MALSVAKNTTDGLYYVGGLTRQNTPYPIGRHYFRPGDGPHYIGFDDSFAEPLVVKAFYDPTNQALPPLQYIGYMQFMQLNFAGRPIPPNVYGGKLADRAPYVCDEEHGFIFVDFMGPMHANMLKPSDDSFEPFYPYNGMLYDGNARSKIDLSGHPLPNGSFLFPYVRSDTQSLAASLFAEAPVSLVTESDVTRFVSDDNLIAAITVTSQQLAEKEAYQIALDYLTATGQMLEGLTPSQVSGQVVGNYVLITLPDDEEFTPSLCVTTATKESQQYVLAYLISYYDMASMQEDAITMALNRINQFLGDDDVGIPTVMETEDDSDTPRGLGSSGLMTSPFALEPGGFHIELKYWTVAIAGMRYLPSLGRTTLQPLSGFTWSALLSYDEDAQSLDLVAIRAPELIEAFDYLTPVNQYFAALANPELQNTAIDMSNFTKASMRRQNFGADVKPNYVNGEGVTIISA